MLLLIYIAIINSYELIIAIASSYKRLLYYKSSSYRKLGNQNRSVYETSAPAEKVNFNVDYKRCRQDSRRSESLFCFDKYQNTWIT